MLDQTIDDERVARFNVTDGEHAGLPDRLNILCLNLFVDKFDEDYLKGFVDFGSIEK